MSATLIREEQPEDIAGVYRVEEAAFSNHPHSNGAEPMIVDALRATGDLTLSLVARDRNKVVGHAAWSSATLFNGESGWFALGPIAVSPERQGEGIGRALIEAGIAHFRAAGAKGIVLLGDPKLYARFGFRRDTPLHIIGALAEYFQVLPFVADVPDTVTSFAPAFALAEVSGA